MSIQTCSDPDCADHSNTSGIAAVIDARVRDLGGFAVRRLLPAGVRQSVGPFIFFDHAGPTTLESGTGIDIRPHPHIGLCTVSYLFSGAIVHRDSLGSEQTIWPGDLALMPAGRGIVHSERTPQSLRDTGATLHALQLWIALPQADEECAPAFHYHRADSLPTISQDRAQLRVLMGQAYGVQSPVATFAPTFYVDVILPAGAELPLPEGYEERALYIVSGSLVVGRERAEPGRMLVFKPNAALRIQAERDTRLVLFGGAALDGPRYLFWNFVSSSPERIEQAKRDWQQGRFPRVPGDDAELTPLPE